MHTQPGDVLLAEHKFLETKTKTALAQVTARAAEAASKAEKPIDVSNTRHPRDLAAAAAGLFGWNTDGPQVQVNTQIRITQEQLEQIRQLRGVPEPEELQDAMEFGLFDQGNDEVI
jgi:hypothetical protein